MPDEKSDPSKPSGDYKAMIADWKMIADILAGARAVKAAGHTYLPQYEKETPFAWGERLKSAPWRPEFDDALRSLCSKPFTQKVDIEGSPPEDIKKWADDIDGKGHNLHVFAREFFRDGVAKGFSGIYVTYSGGMPARTKAEETALGKRPYWVPLKAEDVLALYTTNIAGKEVVEHIRIMENTIRRDGFDETLEERVRVLELEESRVPTSTLWEKQAGDWIIIEGPIALNGVDEIPVVLFFTGERSGAYRVRPPLIDLAHMQIELYRGHSRKDEVLTYAGSPMLKATGMEEADVTVGPKSVLFAPSAASGAAPDWNFIQPNAANITEIRADLESTTEDFRRLAMQPTMPQSGNLIATGAAIEAAKAHSAIEAWAMALKDAIEQALVYTCQWAGLPDVSEVKIHTDFGVDIDGGADMSELLKARMAGEISRETYWDELLRRGKLGPQFDPDEEQLRLESEAPAFDPRLSVSGLSEMAQLQGSDVSAGGLTAPALAAPPTGPSSVPQQQQKAA